MPHHLLRNFHTSKHSSDGDIWRERWGGGGGKGEGEREGEGGKREGEGRGRGREKGGGRGREKGGERGREKGGGLVCNKTLKTRIGELTLMAMTNLFQSSLLAQRPPLNSVFCLNTG